jgi:hypothetical protein
MNSSLNSLCRQIRRIVAQPDLASTTELNELVGRYRVALETANERIDRAHDWLRNGMRSEALRLVEQQPDAIEAVAQLSMGYAWGSWDRLCKANGIVDVQRPDLDAAADLCDAYDREELLAPHLAKHRMLALASAPTADRLEMLLALEQLDPDNSAWPTQRGDLEAHRINEIEKEAQLAIANRNFKALESLQAELTHRDWISQPPDRLLQVLGKSIHKLKYQHAMIEFARISNAMSEAHATKDENAMRMVVVEWEQLISDTRFSPSSAIADIAKGPMNWWQERENERECSIQFQRDLARLEELLDSGEPANVLEPLYERLKRAEREIPKALVSRYRSRQDEHSSKSRVRTKLIAVAVIAAIAISGTSVWWWLGEQGRARTLSTWVTQLDTALESGDSRKSQKLLDELLQGKPELWNEAEIVTRREEHDALIKEDAARRSNLEACINEISAADPLDHSIDSVLDEARKLARFEDEKLDVATLRNKISKTRRDHQSGLDQDFQTRFSSLNEKYREILESDIPYEQAVGKLEQLVRQYDELRRAENVSDELISAVGEQLLKLREDLSARKDRKSRSNEVGDSLGSIRNSFPDLAKLAKAEQAFVDTFPERPEAVEFQRVLRHEPAWRTLQDWNTLAGKWNGDIGINDAEKAKACFEATAQAAATVDSVIGKDFSEQLSGYFANAVKALDPKDSGTSRLRQLFEPPSWMARLKQTTIEATDGDRRQYYLLGELRCDDSICRMTGVIKSLESLDDPEKREQERVPVQPKPRIEDAPIAIYAKNALRFLRDMEPSKWRTSHLGLARKIAKGRNINVVLRLRMIRNLIALHLQETWPQNLDFTELGEYLVKVEQAEYGRWPLDDVPWPHVNSGSVKNANRAASELLNELPDLESLIKQSDEAFQKLHLRAKPLNPIGLVWTDEDAHVILDGVSDGEIGVVHLNDSGQIDIELCGHVSSGEVTFISGKRPAIGTPLFQRPPWMQVANSE